MLESSELDLESCRICLTNEKPLCPLFRFKLSGNYAEMLTAIADVQVSANDGLPEKICSKCCTTLEEAYLLKTVAERSDKKLRKLLVKQKLSTPTKDIAFVSVTDVKSEIPFTVKSEPKWEIDIDLNTTTETVGESSSNLVIEDTVIREQEQDIALTPPETSIQAQNASDNLLPNSKARYLATYETFMQWKNSQNDQSFSENVLLAYFHELENKYSPSSLWCFYSMLRSTIKIKHNIDIKTYCNLIAFIKRRADGYVGRKSKVLLPTDVEKFLNEAPDSQYLAIKVALIFGVTGACRRQELCDITTEDVKTHGEMLLVKIPKAKKKIPRSFTIDGPFYEIVKKYIALRPPNVKNNRFFLNYQKGKCTAQPIGINKLGTMPREIAKYLNLPESDTYTGHSFRRTSAALLADSRADMLSLKRHGEWRSDAVAESYIENSMHNKAKISATITSAIKLEPQRKKFCPEPQQSTFGDNDFSVSPDLTNDNDPIS